MAKITSVLAREILDSRGDPTVEVELRTDGAASAIASVPSGASVGSHEAVELRDNDPARFGGLGALKAIKNIEQTIAPALVGQEVGDQQSVDQMMIDLDGTPHKSKLGANAILAVSMAACKAAARSQNEPLYKYIANLLGEGPGKMPTPMFNFIEGAKHADNNLEIQEYLAIPRSQTFKDNYREGSEAFHNLKKILKNRGVGIAVGHEGGFAPMLPSSEEPLKLINDSGEVALALDLAGVMPNGLSVEKLIDGYGVISFEDPAEEDDWEKWAEITGKFGGKAMIVGDDILATNIERLKQAVSLKAVNALIVKPNQVGTISETLEFVKLAKQSKYRMVVSHRSGETEDTFIADFAVGAGADFAKFGAPSRGERVAKYNRLLRIEEEMAR